MLDGSLEEGKRYTLVLTLDAGLYELQDTWRIDGEHVPNAIVQLTIEGQPSAATTLSGSTALGDLGIDGVERDGQRVTITLRASLMPPQLPPDEERDAVSYPTLFDASGPMTVARWPNSGWAKIGMLPTDSIPADTGGGRRTAQFLPVEEDRLLRWPQERNTWIWGYFRWNWYDEHIAVHSIESSRGVTLPRQPRYGMVSGGRFRIMNALSELDWPGEYYIDPQARVLTAALRGKEDPAHLRLSRLRSPLVELRGLRDVDVRNLFLTQTRGDGLAVEESEDIRIDGVRFSDIGRNAVVVNGGRDVVVRNVSATRIGHSGVLLSGGDRSELRASGHRIEHSSLSAIGTTLETPQAAIKLLGVGAEARANSIRDCAHMAIYFEGNNHLIEGNYIEDVVNDTGDAGAIYALRDWSYRGNVIRNNIIANVEPHLRGESVAGVYLDDMLSGILVENNLFFNVQYAVLIGGGRDNLVRGNLFVRSTIPIHIDDRGLTWAQAAVLPGGILPQRLQAVPHRSEVWIRAYPDMSSLQDGSPGIPANNRVLDNASIGGGASSISAQARLHGTIHDLEAISVPFQPASTLDEFLAQCRADEQCRQYAGSTLELESVGVSKP